MKKSWIYLTTVSLTALSVVHADAPGKKTANSSLQPSKKSNAINMNSKQGAPTGAPRAQNGWNVFVQGDVFYWKATENGLTPVAKDRVVSTSVAGDVTRRSKEKYQELKFKNDWGGRLGIGYHIPHDQWDILVDWTHFKTHARKHNTVPLVNTLVANFDGTILRPLWLDGYTFNAFSGANFSLTDSLGKWRLNLNLLDGEVGRQFFVSKWLTIRPHVGVRGGWVNQHYTIDYLLVNPTAADSSTYKNSMKNNFAGAGVRAGLDTQWGLFKELSVYADAAIALVWGQFNVKQNVTFFRNNVSVGATTDRTSVDKKRFRMSRAITDLSLGLRWDHMFADQRFHLRLQGGWEQHVLFGQNQLFLNTLPAPRLDRTFTNDDLTLQGWTLGARFDF